MTCLVVVVVGCSPARHIGGTTANVTGHAEWVGGPVLARDEPAFGVTFEVTSSGASVASGATDQNGDFAIGLPDGSYVWEPEPDRGCLAQTFTVPTSKPLAFVCQRR